MFRLGNVTINPHYEPPRPAVTPRPRLAAIRHGTVQSNVEYVEDWGQRQVRHVRFVSSETQGFLTPSEVAALIDLYQSSSTFELETDLLSPLGEPPVVYVARFNPEEQPVFSPAVPSGELYYLDLPLIIY